MLQGEHSAILSTFIKLPFVIKIFVVSIFDWPFYTGFTVVTWLFLSQNICELDSLQENLSLGLKGEHSAILLIFIKLPFVIKIFVLSIFERLFYTSVTVIFS